MATNHTQPRTIIPLTPSSVHLQKKFFVRTTHREEQHNQLNNAPTNAAAHPAFLSTPSKEFCLCNTRTLPFGRRFLTHFSSSLLLKTSNRIVQHESFQRFPHTFTSYHGHWQTAHYPKESFPQSMGTGSCHNHSSYHRVADVCVSVHGSTASTENKQCSSINTTMDCHRSRYITERKSPTSIDRHGSLGEGLFVIIGHGGTTTLL